MFDVLVNGHKTSDFQNIWVATIPQITPSQVERDRFAIPQRDGDMLSAYYRRTSAYIEVTFHALNILQNKRIIKSVFCNQINEAIRTSITLPTISIINRVNGVDNYDSYYNIKNAVITEDVLNDDNYGRVTIQYEIEPFEYLLNSTTITKSYQGSESGTSETVQVTNSGDTCKPLVTIQFINSSEQIIGNITLTLNVDTGSNVTFTTLEHKNRPYFMSDTNLMYTWRQNADASSTSPCEDNFTTHNYEDLWIPHGTHDIKLTKTLSNILGYYKISINLREGYAI